MIAIAIAITAFLAGFVLGALLLDNSWSRRFARAATRMWHDSISPETASTYHSAENECMRRLCGAFPGITKPTDESVFLRDRLALAVRTALKYAYEVIQSEARKCS